jgi:hypothetical protein
LSFVKASDPDATTKDRGTNDKGQRMKLNLWQWVGLILMVLAGSFWLWERSQEKAINDHSVPTTQSTR